ncbi:MAG: 6-phosphogluconolactonase [Gammaproteobacteria bacterium]|nr:6-phosphogluconolactonase [Gammaproteobacteria bacterium]
MRSPNIYPSADELCSAAADFWLAAYSAAVIEHGSFHVALSGGTTPKRLYEKLATAPYQSKINWQNVHIYFGDERFVPLDHPDSNYNMANTALFALIDCPPSNIHPVSVESESADFAANQYEAVLLKELPKNSNNTPQFDLVLLGLGPDGHTASLFPGTDAVNEKIKLCRAVFVTKLDSWRVSITFPVINDAKNILLLSEGSGKVDIIKTLTDKNTPELSYPIQYVRQTSGFFWYADKAATP